MDDITAKQDPRDSLPPDSHDRRRATRYYCAEIEVTMESDHNFFMGFSENISEGGLFIATHVVHPIGTIVDLQFRIPGRDCPIQAKGEVRWVRPFSERTDAPPGMGIRFREISSDQADSVRRFLAARTPIFYDD